MPESGVVGYVGADVPRELIAAAGLYPLRVKGSVPLTMRADEILGPGVAAPERRVLAGLLEGRPRLDFLVLSHDSDSTVRLFTALRVLSAEEPLPELWFLDVLHLPTETTAAYNRARIDEFLEVLGRWSGRPVSDESLDAARREAAETRSLLARVDALRHSGSLRGSEALAVAGATGCLPAAEANRLLEDAPGGSARSTSGAVRRVFVTGSDADRGAVPRPRGSRSCTSSARGRIRSERAGCQGGRRRRGPRLDPERRRRARVERARRSPRDRRSPSSCSTAATTSRSPTTSWHCSYERDVPWSPRHAGGSRRRPPRSPTSGPGSPSCTSEWRPASRSSSPTPTSPTSSSARWTSPTSSTSGGPPSSRRSSGRRTTSPLLRERGYPDWIEQYSAVSLGSTLEDDPEQAPWGGLPPVSAFVTQVWTDSHLGIAEAWEREQGRAVVRPRESSRPGADRSAGGSGSPTTGRTSSARRGST